MAEVPVRRLTFSDSRLPTPVSVDLPWNTFTPILKQTLDHLDADDSGELIVTPQTRFARPDLKFEISYDDDSASQFFRPFWAYAGRSSLGAVNASKVQDAIYHKVVEPLLGDYSDLKRWELARDLLVDMADVRHLYACARLAGQLADSEDRLQFLDIAEGFLLEAKRLSADVRHYRSQWYGAVEKELRGIRPALEKRDREQFQSQAKHPYLMAATGAPTTLDLKGSSDPRSGEISIRVAVPKGSKPDDALNFYRDQVRVSAHPSRFQGDRAEETYSLTAVRIVPDIDQEGADFGSHIRTESVSDVAFEGPRDYYRLVFAIKDPKGLLAGREVRKFDLVLEGPEKQERIVPGALVLQDKGGKAVRVVFASDLHISERDYETKKVMIASLQAKAKADGDEKKWLLYANRVERFYSSFNENVEVAIEQWNEAYRRGELDRVVLAGDLADFINIATTLDDQGYRGTNVRRLIHILSKIEAPLLMKPGNHDVHIAPYARGDHKQGFGDDAELYGLYPGHYDAPRMGIGNSVVSKIRSIQALLTRRCETGEYGDLECAVEAVKELLAQYPFSWPSEEGMGPYFRHVENNEADMTLLGHNTYLFQWKTNEEHFNADRWKFEEVHEPVGLNLYRGSQTYIFDQHVNSKGPRPKTFYYFLKCVEKVMRSGGRMIVAEHYPPFFLGKSAADQTPDAADALRGEPNWALRLASYYFRYANGDSVISTVISGHVHRWGEYDFKFDSFATEQQFRADLKRVFDETLSGKITPEEFYEEVHDNLWHKYKLHEKIVTRRVIDDTNGVPGPILREFNADSKAYGQQRGTLFVNLPAIGPERFPGYITMTVGPDGRESVEPRFFIREYDGRVRSGTGRELPAFRNQHRTIINAWKKAQGILIPEPAAPAQAPVETPVNNEMEISGPGTPRTAFEVFDPLPLICQYPNGKFCFGVGVAPAWSFSEDGVSKVGVHVTPLQVTIPLSEHHHSLWGLNYARLALDYSTFWGWDARAGLGLGLVDPYLFSGFRFDDPMQQHYGVLLQVGGSSAAVVPALEPWVSVRGDGKGLQGGVALRWMWELLSVKP